MFKTVAVGAAITVSAGVAATPSAIATYLHHPSAGPGYALAPNDHAEPYHSDPGGEFIRVASAESGGTAAIFHTMITPGGLP
jgi:hypothetical protein